MDYKKLCEVKMADEIQKNHQPTFKPLSDEERKLFKNLSCQTLTAEPKFLDLDTVKCFVEKMKNDASKKADKLQIEIMQASYTSGRRTFLELLGISALTEQKKNNGIFIIWTIIDYCLTCLQELEGLEGDEKYAKH